VSASGATNAAMRVVRTVAGSIGRIVTVAGRTPARIHSCP
jgi:hypothetical protein